MPLPPGLANHTLDSNLARTMRELATSYRCCKLNLTPCDEPSDVKVTFPSRHGGLCGTHACSDMEILALRWLELRPQNPPSNGAAVGN